MPHTGDTIRASSYYWRLARKLIRPGVLPGLVRLARLDNETKQSFASLLEERASKSPHGVGIRFEGRDWTWQEINETSNRYARTLRDRGVVKGDVVAMNITNRAEFMTVLSAVLKVGAVAALINTGLRSNALAHCLRLAAPKVLIIGSEQTDNMESIDQVDLPSDRFFLADAEDPATPAGYEDLDQASASKEASNLPESKGLTFGDTAAYIYTSGTTGLPKAAKVPHRRLFMAGIFSGAVVRELRADDVVYCPLPLYHSAALQGGWASCVYTGATFAPSRRFSATRFWDEVRESGATGFVYVGEILRYLYNQPSKPTDRDHKLKSMMGAGLRSDIWFEFKERFGIGQVYELYGGSETPAGFVNLLNFDQTCGWAPSGWKTVEFDVESGQPVRDSHGRCVEVGPGGVGLLLMKIGGGSHFDGYTDAAETEKKLVRNAFADEDLWFNSGDLMLNQGHGHARFVDRTGDTFRWQSENVATTEVEAVVNGWHQVSESVVYGVQVPHHDGRAGMVRVVLRDGAVLDREGFAKHLRSELPGYAVPRFMRLASEGDVDLTGTFKHQKAELKEAGFDPDKVSEPLLVLTSQSTGWCDLDPELLRSVLSGNCRL